MTPVDLLVHSAAQVVTCGAPGGAKRGAAMRDPGIVAGGAGGGAGGKIVAIGPAGERRRGHEA